MDAITLYMLLRRNVANLSANNWQRTIALFDAIVSNSPAAHHQLRKRASLNGNEVIYRCQFNANAVSFETCKNKLASAFEVDPALITYTTGTQNGLVRPNAFATYRYGTIRLYVGLFGCASDDDLCTREQSWVEALYYVYDQHKAEWEAEET